MKQAWVDNSSTKPNGDETSFPKLPSKKKTRSSSTAKTVTVIETGLRRI
jgi:hypothetical protein